jgi:hypothetical protein
MNVEKLPDESVIRLCMAVEDTPEHHVIGRSIKKRCWSCDREIWYDPNQRVLVNETHLLCAPCFMIQMAMEDGEPMLIPPSIDAVEGNVRVFCITHNKGESWVHAQGPAEAIAEFVDAYPTLHIESVVGYAL